MEQQRRIPIRSRRLYAEIGLPDEVTENVLNNIPCDQIQRVSRVSTQFFRNSAVRRQQCRQQFPKQAAIALVESVLNYWKRQWQENKLEPQELQQEGEVQLMRVPQMMLYGLWNSWLGYESMTVADVEPSVYARGPSAFGADKSLQWFTSNVGIPPFLNVVPPDPPLGARFSVYTFPLSNLEKTGWIVNLYATAIVQKIPCWMRYFNSLFHSQLTVLAEFLTLINKVRRQLPLSLKQQHLYELTKESIEKYGLLYY